MIGYLAQSLSPLLLAGAACYLILISETLETRPLQRRIILGAVLGLVAIVQTAALESTLWEATLPDARAGALIFAGYLGGLPGGGAATAIAIGWAVLSAQPDLLTLAMGLALCCAVGLGTSLLVPVRDWPNAPVGALWPMVAGFAAILALALWRTPMPERAAMILPLAGFLSIPLVWLVVNWSANRARDAACARLATDRLEAVLDCCAMGMVEYRLGDDFVSASDGFVQMYGLGTEARDVPLAEWMERVHPDDLERVTEVRNRMPESLEASESFDFRAIRTDGRQIEVRVHWRTDRGPGGELKQVVALHTDMTGLREAEHGHLESVNRLELIAENLPGVIFQCDVTDRHAPILNFISPRCLDLWGYTDDEFYADPSLFGHCHNPDDLETFQAIIDHSIETGSAVTHRYWIVTKDGRTRWLEYRGGSSQLDGRDLIEAIVLDVTDQIEAQRAVEEERGIALRAQKHESIGQLTGGVAHDFNNLLAAILGNLELLQEDEDLSQNGQDMIAAAIAATLRGADLTRNMLAFARRARLEPEILDLNRIVREAKNWIGRTLPDSVVVETSLLAGLWPVSADRASLESALLNLILNGRDAMAGQGNLTIETANVRIDDEYIEIRREELKPGRYVMLAVSDTGTGIPPDVLPSVFEPFFTTKAPGSGSGLGLSMVMGFMRQSGGTVQVYTEQGDGTTFKLYFPAVEMPEAKPAIRPPRVYEAGRPLRILLAEDEQDVREMLVRTLENAKHIVTAAASGDQALAVFRANPEFDLLLTDVVMPGKLQGTDLARTLRMDWPDLPVVFMSGYANEATVHGNGLRPEDIRLMKPVQRSDLLAAVQKAVQKPT